VPGYYGFGFEFATMRSSARLTAVANSNERRDDELEWLLAELADEAHFEARFADAQQRFTRIVTGSQEMSAGDSAATPAFDDPEMLQLLLELDPSLADRLDQPVD
jgi:hypothetical protein